MDSILSILQRHKDNTQYKKNKYIQKRQQIQISLSTYTNISQHILSCNTNMLPYTYNKHINYSFHWHFPLNNSSAVVSAISGTQPLHSTILQKYNIAQLTYCPTPIAYISHKFHNALTMPSLDRLCIGQMT